MNWNEKEKEKRNMKEIKSTHVSPNYFPKTRNRDSPNFHFGCFLDYQTKLNV